MKTFVTGAGGFIGGRMVEVLSSDGIETRAGIRRWSTAARIGRLPVEIVQADLTRPDQVDAAVAGMDAVIHCATGPGKVNALGTRNVLEACLKGGVHRVVHLSTIDVYGDATGVLSEDRPLMRTSAHYGDSKIEAEEIVREYAAKGLHVVILRPTIVYGPFSALWVEEFVARLQVRPWPFPRELCSGTCNLVYVDDVVAAARLALQRPEASGEAFNINGPDRPTWFEYFTALNAALELPPIQAASTASSRVSAMAMTPVRKAARFALDHFGDPIMAVYKKSNVAKKLMKHAEAAIRKAPTVGEFGLYSKDISVPTDLARERLGYHPAVDMDRGVRLSADWALFSGLVAGTPR